MPQLDKEVMAPDENPDNYLTEICQIRDELEYIEETFSEHRIIESFWKG